MRNREKNSYSVKAVENALLVLEAIGEVNGEIGITHLSEILSMDKSNVFRLMSTFESRGYVEKNEESGKYRLGLSAYEMGQKFLSHMSLLAKAKPVMEGLARECNEAVYCEVPRDNEVLMLDMVNSTHVVITAPLVGKSYPLCRAAAGKAIWAFRTPLAGKNPQEVSPAQLAELEAIRKLGASVEFGGFGEGTASLAPPFFSAQKKVLGSLCIVVPDFRVNRERIAGELLARLKGACATVSSRLGCLDPTP